jgi:lipocalin
MYLVIEACPSREMQSCNIRLRASFSSTFWGMHQQQNAASLVFIVNGSRSYFFIGSRTATIESESQGSMVEF